MATIKIEPGSDDAPCVWVTLTRFCAEDLARLKAIPGRRWNPERKQWQFPDTPGTRAALAEMVALPPAAPVKMIPVKPKQGDAPVTRYRRPYVAGRDQPLTLNPPHALIKKVDDELVLRGMAYTTRKSYGQHLRNYFDWLRKRAPGERFEPESATGADIRDYLVQMANSGLVSASYCRGARAVLVFLYESVLKQSGKVCDLPRMKRPERLPVVLSREEVAHLFKVTHNLKHKALLTPALA